jgi:hypothetical protein
MSTTPVAGVTGAVLVPPQSESVNVTVAPDTAVPLLVLDDPFVTVTLIAGISTVAGAPLTSAIGSSVVV